MDKAKKSEIIKKFAISKDDSGSAEVQVAVLTGKIEELTQHMRAHKHDLSTRRGLLAMVTRRKMLLDYLAVNKHEALLKVSDALGLRHRR